MSRKLILYSLLFLAPALARAGEIVIEPIPQSVLLQYLAGQEVFELIDARSAEEYAAGHVYGALNVPHDADLSRSEALPESLDTPLVLYCKSGLRAHKLSLRLAEMGYRDVRVLAPGQMMWAEALPVFNCGAAEPRAEILTTVDPQA